MGWENIKSFLNHIWNLINLIYLVETFKTTVVLMNFNFHKNLFNKIGMLCRVRRSRSHNLWRLKRMSDFKNGNNKFDSIQRVSCTKTRKNSKESVGYVHINVFICEPNSLAPSMLHWQWFRMRRFQERERPQHYKRAYISLFSFALLKVLSETPTLYLSSQLAPRASARETCLFQEPQRENQTTTTTLFSSWWRKEE